MDFKELNNPWSEYLLPDGRKLRVRHILTQVDPNGILDAEGNQQFNLTFSCIAVAEQVTPTTQVSFAGNAADALAAAIEMPLSPIKKTDLQ